ncbi:hypothetical protein ACHAW5_008497 [Stephanodiscus triporus]|uniref:N-acetyltransferase domain-containing protein n=1 Tax=Stephanodiscus triporus TaxID=2934178 RepID=A0ABD3MFA4_9STRA
MKRYCADPRAFIRRPAAGSRHRRLHRRPDPPSTVVATRASRTRRRWRRRMRRRSPRLVKSPTSASSPAVELKFTTLGPGYRCVAVSKADPDNVLGYVEGFVRPMGRILHADKMEIFKGAIGAARREEGGEFDGGGTFLGPGLLIAYVCVLHGRECGCATAEFLAIDDAEFQHRRLIRYYKMMGFREVRYVGEELRDIPDRLVWGGCGTLMTEDINIRC